ncbi:MAG: cell division protein FtsQ/DivIB [Planctomycetota bacterium]
MARAKKPASRRPDLSAVPWRRVGSVALSIGCVAAVVVGMGLADRRAGSLLGQTQPMVRFTWAEAVGPTGTGIWPPSDVQMELDEQAHQIVAASDAPLAVDLLERLGTWVVETGWVSELRSVERSDPGVITIDASWRAPAGVIRQNGYDYLVSTGGRRLDAQWRQETAGLPVIVGAERSTAATSVLPGTLWPDRAVLAGVELLTLLQHELGVDPILGPGGFDQIWGIDVGDFDRHQRLVIVTDLGNRIIWGRAPSDQVSDLVPTHQKLKNLGYMRRHPDYGKRIDASQALLDLSSGPILVDDRPSRPDNLGQ